MKKMMLVSLMLTVAMATQAQLGRKIAPKMEKGTSKTYVTTMKKESAGQAAYTVTTEDTYTVTDATADGYVIDVVTTSVNSDAAADNMEAQLELLGQQMVKGVHIQIVTDKDGKAVTIANADELKQQMMTQGTAAVDKLYKATPAMEQTMPKDMLLGQLKLSLTDESMLNGVTGSSSVLFLNGKTVMTGAQESAVDAQGIKTKRMYFLSGDNITTNASLDMTKDDLKALIIKQVEASLPAEQVAMIKQNIDQLMDSDMLKVDLKETATYEFEADGWLKSIKVETTKENAGQQGKTTTVVTAK